MTRPHFHAAWSWGCGLRTRLPKVDIIIELTTIDMLSICEVLVSLNQRIGTVFSNTGRSGRCTLVYRSMVCRKCPEVLGNDQGMSKRWEDIIYSFFQAGKLNVSSFVCITGGMSIPFQVH